MNRVYRYPILNVNEQKIPYLKYLFKLLYVMYANLLDVTDMCTKMLFAKLLHGEDYFYVQLFLDVYTVLWIYLLRPLCIFM